MISFKWISISCFLIETIDGTIVTDPFVLEASSKQDFLKEIKGTDITLISHSHFDHIYSLDTVYENSNSNFFINNMYAKNILELFDLSGQRIYPVFPNQTEYINNFELKPIFSRHAIPQRETRKYKKDSYIIENTWPAHVDEKFKDIMQYGYMSVLNYHIKLSNGETILFWSGDTLEGTNKKTLDVIGRNTLDYLFIVIPSNSIENIQKVINLLKPRYIIPHHHDVYDDERQKDIIFKLNEFITELGFDCQLVSAIFNEEYKLN